MGHSDLAGFIAGLPKAELHVHQVGSASPRIVAELAARYPESPVPKTPELVGDYFRFSDFAHFVTVYLSVVDLVRTPEDVRMLTYEIAREMAGQRIRYAERTCSPYTSVLAGVGNRAQPRRPGAVEDVLELRSRDTDLRPTQPE
jgi:aminodeoxyfutalosine deaminase